MNRQLFEKIFLCVILLFAASIKALNDEIELWTNHGKLMIQKHKLTSHTAHKDAMGEKQYVYAIFTRVPNRKQIFNLENNSGVKFVSIYTARHNYIIYILSFYGALDEIMEKLKEIHPGFFNLEPIYDEDKLSHKIKTGKGFKEGEKTEDGRIIADVQCFNDVDVMQCRQIIEENCKGIMHPNARGYVVKEHLQNLQNLREILEISSVYELNTTSRIVNDVARDLTGVNAIQNIEGTSKNYIKNI